MKIRELALVSIILVCWSTASAVPAQNEQSSGTTQSSAGTHRAAGGQRVLTGCVAREGEGFVLKTEEGTYEFNTSRDLTPYVGKKVRISGRWSATGVTTTVPIKGAEGGTAAEGGTEAPAEKKAPSHAAFVGDLHVHITGEVIGDCAQAP